jgi:1,4-dihydroxy-2-naphthoate octaprenyltransferase
MPKLAELLFRMPQVDESTWKMLSAATRWLIMVRAAVLIMTVISVIVGVIVAAMDGHFYLHRAVALLVGLICAHATNNLVNDLVDWHRGLDRDNYYRRQYGVHVLEQHFVDEKTFLLITAGTGLVALLSGLWLTWFIGSDVLYLMAVGAFFVMFYTWPLKVFALGELSVLLVWGPLMTAGSYFVMAGTVSWEMMLISIIYGIGPTLVIFGKHIDKADQDKDRHVNSLPVVIGEEKSRWLSLCLVALQWVLLIGMAVITDVGTWFWLCLGSLPALYGLVRLFQSPRPVTRPDEYPEAVWPLWFSAVGFRYSRDFGSLLVLALFVSLVW